MDKYGQKQAGQQDVTGGEHGRSWDSFPKPAGWSVRWDGVELDRAMQQGDQESVRPVSESSNN